MTFSVSFAFWLYFNWVRMAWDCEGGKCITCCRVGGGGHISFGKLNEKINMIKINIDVWQTVGRAYDRMRCLCTYVCVCILQCLCRLKSRLGIKRFILILWNIASDFGGIFECAVCCRHIIISIACFQTKYNVYIYVHIIYYLLITCALF